MNVDNILRGEQLVNFTVYKSLQLPQKIIRLRERGRLNFDKIYVIRER